MKTTSKLFIHNTKIPEIPIMQIDISKTNVQELSLEPSKYEITNLIRNEDGSISCEAKIHDKNLLDAIAEGLMVCCSHRSNYDENIKQSVCVRSQVSDLVWSQGHVSSNLTTLTT